MGRSLRKVIVCFGVIAFVSLFAAAYSQPYGSGQRKGKGLKKGWGRGKILKELNLTDEQKKELREQSAAYRENIKSLRKQIREEKRKLKELLGKSGVDKKEIDSTIEKLSSLSEEQLRQIVDKIISTKKILTPEQFKELQEKIGEARKRVREHFGGKNSKGNPFSQKNTSE